MTKTIHIGLCGLGTVGSGVVRILQDHRDQIKYKLGCEVSIKKILVSDIHKKRDINVIGSELTTDPKSIIQDPDIDIIIEVMGGIEKTYQLMKEAILHHKHIVTANKDVMALYGQELLPLAKDKEVDVFYEASVAGGIPILRALSDGLASDKIQKMMGIVNGTTNFILTKMADEQRPFGPVLEEAQQLGYAEADPSSDVDGLDAARKMTLLANLAFKTTLELSDVQVKGIRSITQEDLTFAAKLGYTIKLIGIAEVNDEGKVEVSVEPTLLPNEHPLAQVKNEYNAVYVHGEAVGETMFYGPGAGGLPTATSIVSDVMEAVKNVRLGINGHAYVIPQYKKKLKTDKEKFMKFFIRMEVDDTAGTFQKLTNVFTGEQVSFAKILQLPSNKNQTAEIVMVTHSVSREQLRKSLEQIMDLSVVKKVISYYRVDGEE
ncbi:homoserine dehydrogenase [Radiobacillus deserti]|uniref:Homoserine dehydrogenase n=1 Tax=Radiobacillus deserti TaxID=2594883 RepID=A0A516KHW5_9BACI|nr:homoserine dehydrogenase [Radiobacillus deserti]QDP40979.1 homoserine dehydrogenase [Radiobacillus deserti]